MRAVKTVPEMSNSINNRYANCTDGFSKHIFTRYVEKIILVENDRTNLTPNDDQSKHT